MLLLEKNSMHPILFHLGQIEIRTYAVTSIIAMFAAMIVALAEAKRFGWNLRVIAWLTIQSTVIGFIGSHLLYAITRFDLPSERWWKMFFNFAYGHVWFGGFLAAWFW